MMNFLRRKPNIVTAQDILHQILEAKPKATAMAPRDCRGIYGLVDHLGDLRYIGSTSSAAETFYKRIHQRHRTGSETSSHYFSRMYNTGRMWRLRNDPATKADGDIAKTLRNAFIAEYCRAVWVPLADDLDIAGLEAEVITLAPQDAIAWNRRGMDAYPEPADLVDLVIRRLGFGAAELSALERQRARYLGGETPSSAIAATPSNNRLRDFPQGPFRFVALDVETANHDRASICQIGVACVRADNSIDTWTTYIDPRTTRWAFTGLHGISNATVKGAPTFDQVLPLLEASLSGLIVYQHSGFDRSAFRAACAGIGCPEPEWDWQNSVTVARQAWPELKGNGGHGLASLKGFLGLSFDHHDAGEDARAAAEVVLHAEGSASSACHSVADHEEFDVIEAEQAIAVTPTTSALQHPISRDESCTGERRLLGYTALSQGNIKNNHFYLRDIWTAFPDTCIGGPNAATAASPVTIDWGGDHPAITNLDGKKKLFRKRGWVREFFESNNAEVGDRVALYRTGVHRYAVAIVKG